MVTQWSLSLRNISYIYLVIHKTILLHKKYFSGNLLSYIMFLRITPFLPNWFINIVSPVIGRLCGVWIRDVRDTGVYILPTTLILRGGGEIWLLYVQDGISNVRSLLKNGQDFFDMLYLYRSSVSSILDRILLRSCASILRFHPGTSHHFLGKPKKSFF